MDYTHLIERLETFEERLGVRLDALYATIADGISYSVDGESLPAICVTGEIHPREGTAIAQKIKIIADAYDMDGRVVCTNGTLGFDPKTFFGYETFQVFVGGIPTEQIRKIRVYPKATLY